MVATALIKDSFPTSELTLCTRHLSENVTRHLRTKVGVNDKNAKQILSDLFGDNGLIEADTTVDFSTKVTDIERKYEDLVGPYLTQKVIPTIRDYVYNARKTESRIPLQWKNNNCESINHILKLNQDWKPEKLPELINKIHKEIKLQESLVNGALYGHGDFELSSSVLMSPEGRVSVALSGARHIGPKATTFYIKKQPSMDWRQLQQSISRQLGLSIMSDHYV
ncbi:unnamed protein product [Mytilus edulis]|uniref:Uncharacterized protein n=1 Tax=Mytilus edulis TaxID=6550 RepID=A0A8S3T245_MYTED|nr:unnamed protein product [Mytilus edulis]